MPCVLLLILVTTCNCQESSWPWGPFIIDVLWVPPGFKGPHKVSDHFFSTCYRNSFTKLCFSLLSLQRVNISRAPLSRLPTSSVELSLVPFHTALCCVLSCSVVSDSLQPYGLQLTNILCPWDSPGKNTGVDCQALLQRIFPTQGSQKIHVASHYLIY